MKCDLCENEATVRETSRRNGVTIEKHLCEACAAAQGIDTGGGAFQKMIEQIASGPASVNISIVTGGTKGGAARLSVCPSCRLTFNEFKQSGLLGCADCYRAFEGQLGPLVERAHQGGVAHCGKVPRRQSAGKPASPVATSSGLSLEERAARLRALQLQLEQAVKSEQYEVAAKVRDQIRKLGGSEA